MKWIAIAGTWRNINEQVEKDVRREVSTLIQEGNGIVTGGALGVDFFATDEALKADPSGSRVKIFLPSTVERYAAHFRKRAEEGVITSQAAEELIAQIEGISRSSIIENPENEVIDKDAYFDRITHIVGAADELIAFQVNNSEGTQDTINKAEKKGIPVNRYAYTI